MLLWLASRMPRRARPLRPPATEREAELEQELATARHALRLVRRALTQEKHGVHDLLTVVDNGLGIEH